MYTILTRNLRNTALAIPFIIFLNLQDIDPKQNKNTCSHIPYIEPYAEYSLKNAEELEGASNFGEAIKIYAYIMENHKNTVIKQSDNNFLGAWYYCLKRISTWPVKGKSAYRNYFDKPCQLAFEQAKAQKDIQKLIKTAREYPFSTYTIPCLVYSANLAIEEGNLECAITLLEEVIENCLIKETVDETAKKLALLYHITLERKKLEKLDSKFEIKYIKELLNKTQEQTINDPQVNRDKFGDFTKVSQVELPAVKFSTSLGSDGFYRNAEFNPHCPTIKDGFLYIANEYSVRAYDLFSSGELVWHFDLPPPPGELSLNDRVMHYLKIEDGICYVNLITSLGKSEVIRQWGLTVKYPFPKRSLCALDAYNGKLIWKKEDLSYTSSPCIENEFLFIGGIKQDNPTDPFEHFIVCLNKNSGDVVWKTKLAKGVTEINLFGNCIRESIGSPTVINGDTVFYSTNLGGAAGIEKNTGSIKWLFKYEMIPIESTRFYPVVNQRGWINNKPLITNKGFIFTPTDSDYLYHVEKDTGNMIYKIKRHTSNSVLGFHENKLFIAGDEIAIVDITSAKKISASIKCNTAGTGTVTDGFIVAPTANSIHFYDVNTNKLIKTHNCSSTYPNLAIGEESLVFTDSNGATQIFFEKSNIDPKEEKNPILFKHIKAITMLRKGDLQGAKELLESTLKDVLKTPSMAKIASISKARLYLILLKLLEKSLKDKDFITAESLTLKALEICKSKEDEIALLFKLSYINSRKDPRKAISILQQMIREYPDYIYESHNVFDTAKEIIDVIIKANGRSIFKEPDINAKELFETGLKLKSSIDLKKVFDLYPNSELSEQSLNELCKIFFENEKYDEVLSALRKTIKYFPNSENIAQYHADAAKCYHKKKLYDSAHREIAILINKCPNSKVSWDDKAYKPNDLLALIRTSKPANLLPIKAPVSKIASISIPHHNQIITIIDDKIIVQPDDKTITAFEIKLSKQSWKFETNSRINYISKFEETLIACCSNSIHLINSTDGQKTWEYNQDRMISPTAAGNGFLVCSSTKGMSSEIILFDILSKSKSWSALVKGITSDLSISPSHVIVKTLNPESIYLFETSSGIKKLEKPLEKKSFLPGSLLETFEDFALIKYENSLLSVDLKSNKNWEIAIDRNAAINVTEKYSVILDQSRVTVVDNKNGKRVTVKDSIYKKFKSSVIHGEGLVIAHEKISFYKLPDLSLGWESIPFKQDSTNCLMKSANNYIAVLHSSLRTKGDFEYKMGFLDASDGKLTQEVASDTSILPVEVDIMSDKLLLKANDQLEIYK